MKIDHIHQGDCLDWLRTLPAGCVTAVVTDPPYGLRFMGKRWDYDVPGAEVWREVLRVAKPGAVLLCFAGTRTQHRMAANIEDAGWEIRDCLMWLYGSGFPKSKDVSKAIDVAAGAERERVPVGDGHSSVSISTSGYGKAGWAKQADVPITEAAKTWDGWGSALKPAYEPIIMAMKPLDGTYAENAIKHGVAGLNIDAGMVGIEKRHNKFKGNPSDGWGHSAKGQEGGNDCKGRWPANIILDPEAGEMLDAQSGESKSTGGSCGHVGMHKFRGDKKPTWKGKPGLGDHGGASRFFYCAKASAEDRGPGNNHPTVKPCALMRYLVTLVTMPEHNLILDPFAGSGTTLLACRQRGLNFLGAERDPEQVATIKRRLEQEGGVIFSKKTGEPMGQQTKLF